MLLAKADLVTEQSPTGCEAAGYSLRIRLRMTAS